MKCYFLVQFHFYSSSISELFEYSPIIGNSPMIIVSSKQMVPYKDTVHGKFCCKVLTAFGGVSMKRPVNDQKDTHLTCTDKHASQMKHSSCCWLLFLEEIIFHLPCKQACGHFSAYLQLCVCICRPTISTQRNVHAT